MHQIQYLPTHTHAHTYTEYLPLFFIVYTLHFSCFNTQATQLYPQSQVLSFATIIAVYLVLLGENNNYICTVFLPLK